MLWKRAKGSIRTTALAAAVGVLSSVLVAGGNPALSATTSTATFYSAGDAYVSKKYPAKNFGSQSVVRVDASPIERSYLRFSVANLAGTVSRATLRLYVRDSHSRGFDVAATASTWGDRTITWNNAPAVGPVVASSGPTTAGSWLSIDVTPLVAGNGSVAVALTTTSSSSLRLSSKESGGNGPRLVVETVDSSTTTTTTTTAPPPSGDPLLVAAGDIACPTTASAYNGGLGTATRCRQKATSDLALSLGPDALAVLGDQQYDSGALDQFRAAYDPAWGRLKSLTRPTAGNHEYNGDSTAAGYYTYFGAAAGSPEKGYYSYDLGGWHVVVLNSNCSQVGGCSSGSPQETWLRADLAAHPAACTLAYWHHPRWSSGQHGNNGSVDAFWRALYAAGADVVLSGHDHHYERFAPQNPSGAADPAVGIRQFVVGTGGASQYAISTVKANSEKRITGAFGVLALTLHDGGYDWRFVSEAGGSVTDSGTGSCR